MDGDVDLEQAVDLSIIGDVDLPVLRENSLHLISLQGPKCARVRGLGLRSGDRVARARQVEILSDSYFHPSCDENHGVRAEPFEGCGTSVLQGLRFDVEEPVQVVVRRVMRGRGEGARGQETVFRSGDELLEIDGRPVGVILLQMAAKQIQEREKTTGDLGLSDVAMLRRLHASGMAPGLVADLLNRAAATSSSERPLLLLLGRRRAQDEREPGVSGARPKNRPKPSGETRRLVSECY